MSFSIIAAVGQNLELGKDGGLVFHIKKDMAFFKRMTMGHKILMGRKTFESIKKPLIGRENYVATRSTKKLPEGIKIVEDLEKFISENKDSSEEIFVIGGAEIYKKLLPYAKKIYLTEIEAEAKADTFFPDFDKTKYVKMVLEKGEEDDITYSFVKYLAK